MREIATHHDGHGLAESIRVRALDEPGPGGAHHVYEVTTPLGVVGYAQYQKGPRGEPSSTPGLLDSCLLAMVRDRMECFQAGPFACAANALVLEHVTAAMAALKARADERAARGVLGKNRA
jgi:hypothetical protein